MTTLQDYIKLAEAATAGPWRTEVDNVFCGETCQATYIADCNPMEDMFDTTANANAQFIAASRTLGPAMAKALIEAEEALNAAQCQLPHDGKLNNMAHNSIEQALSKIQKLKENGNV